MRPIAPGSAHQRLPSGPAVMACGPPPGPASIENSVNTPAGVMRPIRRPLVSVPEVAVGARDDRARAAARRDARRELGHHAGRCDAPDPPRVVLREPEVAVGPGRDAERPATLADALEELRDDPAWRDPPDRVTSCSVNHRLPSGPAVISAGPAGEGDAFPEFRDGRRLRRRRGEQQCLRVPRSTPRKAVAAIFMSSAPRPCCCDFVSASMATLGHPACGMCFVLHT